MKEMATIETSDGLIEGKVLIGKIGKTLAGAMTVMKMTITIIAMMIVMTVRRQALKVF